jgi:peptide/nickel transport system permease protein
VGMLPWFSGRDPAQTILRARSADQEATAEALAAIRADLGLDAGAWGLLDRWVSAIPRGDFGTSWVSGDPVLPGLLDALTVSLTLMGFALLVAGGVAALVMAPALIAGLRGRPSRTSGAAAAALTALPEFLLASLLLLVGAVWLGWFPPYGWTGPASAVLPALALGLPAGGLIGRLAAEAVAVSFTESWVTTWAVAGFSRPAVTRAVLRRALPGLLPQVGLVMVGITGGAVSVEVVFAIPGLGRAALGAADSQDLPALQTAVLILLLLGIAFGVVADLARRAILGGALTAGALSVPPARFAFRRRQLIAPVVSLVLLVGVVAAGVGRDPFTSAWAKLTPPSGGLPFGADAGGRDLLARVAHGAAATIGIAVVVALACIAMGLIVGLAPRIAAGPIEIANAVPPVITGLLIAAGFGATPFGAAVAVTLVSWAPLAAHTAALVSEARAQPYVRILPVLGVGPARLLLTAILPTVVGPVVRHGLLRLPGIALALAALGFLGLGSQPPSPDWGLVLAEGLPYVERAPWVVIAPMAALVAVSVLAVSMSAIGRLRRR